MKNRLDIPVTWVYEQIKNNPGMYASAWNRLLDLWDEHLSKTANPKEDVNIDKYVRMHKDPTEAQKFWRNE